MSRDDPEEIIGGIAEHSLPLVFAGLALIPIVGWLIVKAIELVVAIVLILFLMVRGVYRMFFPEHSPYDYGPNGLSAHLDRQWERRFARQDAKQAKVRNKAAKKAARIAAVEAKATAKKVKLANAKREAWLATPQGAAEQAAVDAKFAALDAEIAAEMAIYDDPKPVTQIARTAGHKTVMGGRPILPRQPVPVVFAVHQPPAPAFAFPVGQAFTLSSIGVAAKPKG